MKILVPAIGSRGDVQPYIALCQGLQSAGHQVTLATNPTLVRLVETYGVRAAPVGSPVDMGMVGEQIWQKAGKNLWMGLIRVMKMAQGMVEAAHPDLLPLAHDADLVIATDISAGAAEADLLGKAWISVTLQPGRIPTSRPVKFPLNLFMPLFNRVVSGPTNAFRRKIGAPQVRGGLDAALSRRMVLLPVSPHIAPRDPLWPGHVCQTGYWNSRDPQDWAPPDDLLDFLSKGEAPVVVSLGVMSLSETARESARITLEALRMSGARAVLQGWDALLEGTALPETVYRAGAMPHSWLFPRACAVVHHGGFGTTASALQAGKPALVIPHIIDQMYWGQRIGELGAGPKYIPRTELTAEKMAAGLREVVENPKLREQAARLGEQIRVEPDGVDCAVEIISANFG